jgi:FkbM family methyltransferase
LNKASPAALFGLARSLLIYYAIPGRARGWERLYRHFVQPGDLCFDIGAHVGNRSAAMLAIGAHVIALEPQPLFFTTLRRLHAKRKTLTVLPQAVGASPAEMQMLLSTRTPTVSTLSTAWADEVGRTAGFAAVEWDERVVVQVTTLDALIASYGLPAFCKIDVEGYELEALQGLSQPIPTISFEYIPAVIEKAFACIARLQQLGSYSYNLITAEVPRFALEQWVHSQEIIAQLKKLSSNTRAGEIYARLDAHA